MNQPRRPTDKELKGKLDEAHKSLCDKPGLVANPGNVIGELNELQINDSAEVWGLIKSVIAEIKPTDYTGGRPPYKSYEKTIEGRDLFAFSWQSQLLGKKCILSLC